MKLCVILIISLVSVVVLGAARPALAAAINGVCDVSGASTTTFCQDTATPTNRISGPDGLIVKGANLISVVAGIAAVIIILIGSIQFILSGGDSGKVSSAKSMIIYALVGLVVIVAAQTIIRFVLGRL